MLLNYSPQSCDPELLRRCTVGDSRLRLLETLIEAVRHELGRAAHQHQILIGPRGSGKTHVFALLVHRLKTEEGLREKVLPVQMPEEVAAGQPADLVAQVIGRLADSLDREPALLGADAAAVALLCRTRLDRIRGLHDDREALALAFDSLDEIAVRTGRLIVAVIENFDSLLLSGAGRGQADRDTPQWAFRRELQERRGVLLLAAAPTAFGEIHDVGAPFHDFLREHELSELSLDEMVAMIRARLEVELGAPHLDERSRRRLQALKADLPRREGSLRGVLALAGGLPRFGHLLFDVIVETEIASSFQMLSRFLDEQTPYFQSWLNPRLVPERELAVLDLLATSEGPLTPTQISRDLRGFPVNAVGVCLKRLLGKRLVRRRPAGGKEVRYDVAEPLLRVWRRFRTGRGEQDRLLLLAEFVAALFEPAELLAERHLLAQASPDTPRLRLLDFALQHQVRLSAKAVVPPPVEAAVAAGHDELRAAAEEEFLHGDVPKAVALMEQAVAATETEGDPGRLGRALGRLSHMALVAGAPDKALRAALRGEEVATATAGDQGWADCTQYRADVLLGLGEAAAARQAYDAAEALYCEVGCVGGRADCIKGRGDVHFLLGENAAARQAYDAAEALYGKVGNDLGRANCIRSHGGVLFRLGQAAAARQAYDAAEALYHKVGDDLGRADCIRCRGDVLLRLRETAAARQAYDAAEALFGKVGCVEGQADCIKSRGDLLFRLGENAAARQAYDDAEALYQKVGSDQGRANCIGGRGDVHFLLGETAAARQAYDAAEALYQKVGDDLGRGNCFWGRGRVRARLGEWEAGLADVRQGLELARKAGVPPNVRLFLRDYLAILEEWVPADNLSDVGGYLRAIAGLADELGADESVRAAFSRLATAVVRRLPAGTAVGPVRDLAALLPETHADLLKPALLAAQVRAGTLPADLPAEPEEVRRVVRLILEAPSA